MGLLIVGAVIGALLSLIAAVVFEKPLSRVWQRVLTRYQLWVHPPPPQVSPHQFCIAEYKTDFFVIDGTGEDTYTPDTIHSRINLSPVDIPPEIACLRAAIENREKEKQAQGLQYQWNGPMYALERHATTRTVSGEHMEVTFTFRPTDYFTFQATVMSLDVRPDGLSLRDKYLLGDNLEQPLPFLANGFGVALVVITKDDKLLLSKRSASVGARPGELDITFAEAVHPDHDRASSECVPNLYRTAIRGALEEVPVDLLESDIEFLGFGVDMKYYQWILVGCARTNATVSEVEQNRTRGSSGKWESKKILPIDSDLRTVLATIRDQKIWPTGVVALYWALVHLYGRKNLETAAREILPSPQSKGISP